MYYAGIGSRDTPQFIMDGMTKLAVRLRSYGYILRSGHARGADTAFENGAGILKEIFLPYDGFEGGRPNGTTMILSQPQWAIDLARDIHPLKKRLSGRNLDFHSRNMMQVLGESGKSPVDFVICWTENGQIKGGTASAIKLAKREGIPVYNLAIQNDVVKLAIMLDHISTPLHMR